LKALTLTAIGGLEHLRLAEVPAPVLERPDDVLVRVRAAALNHLDYWMVKGLPGLPRAWPHVMGSDGAGVVEAVGPAVTGLAPGTPVMLNPGTSCGRCEFCRDGEQPLCPDFAILGEHRPGTLAELVVLPSRNVAPLPAGWSFGEGAAYPLVTLTAWRMLMNRAELGPGETVLLWGIGGGVSLAALKVAQLAGARVVVTSGSDEKLEQARGLGADLALNHSKDDVPKAVRAFTGGRGADVVVDSVGEATWERSLKALGKRGRLVTCGGTSGPIVTTDVRKLFWYQWTILGSTMGSDAEFGAIARLAAENRLRPVLDKTFPLAEAHAAFERLKAGQQLGKIVIEVSHG
jgi:NADPH:quinone reductase-like Zn-dependent oxidoreductase